MTEQTTEIVVIKRVIETIIRFINVCDNLNDGHKKLYYEQQLDIYKAKLVTLEN